MLSKQHEKYAYILDSSARRSRTFRGRKGVVLNVLGEEKFTLLEIIATLDTSLSTLERVHLDDSRKFHTIGRARYKKLSDAEQRSIRDIVERTVREKETWFMECLNTAQAMTYEVHAMEMMLGIGKKYLKTILAERDQKKFDSYEDLKNRTGISDPAQSFVRRIMEEIDGTARVCLFVRR